MLRDSLRENHISSNFYSMVTGARLETDDYHLMVRLLFVMVPLLDCSGDSLIETTRFRGSTDRQSTLDGVRKSEARRCGVHGREKP